VWGGLWAPLEFADLDSAQQSPAVSGQPLKILPVLRHAFTHFDLTITPLRGRWGGEGPADEHWAVEEPQSLWYNLRLPARVGIPAPIAALLASLQESMPAPAAA
jgi:A/G-specific adenine glycosylase